MSAQNISIVVVSDDRYAQHAGTMICSLIENHRSSEPLDIYIIDVSISAANQADLKSLERPGATIRLIRVPDEVYRRFALPTRGQPAMYYRLSIPQVLDEAIEKAIYLDSDMIVLGDVADLWRVELGGCCLAAVEDYGTYNRNRPDLPLPKGAKYFNSGVMIFNLPEWRRQDIAAKVCRYIADHPESIRWWDQDGLNAVVHGRWLALDPSWNTYAACTSVDEYGFFQVDTYGRRKGALSRPNIIHYIPEHKPWHYAYPNHLKRFYFEYLAKTPWKDFQFQDKTPVNRLKKWTFDHCPLWLRIPMQFCCRTVLRLRRGF